jgi:hypothetical protein
VYGPHFKNVTFAIIDDHNSKGMGNFKIFSDYFHRHPVTPSSHQLNVEMEVCDNGTSCNQHGCFRHKQHPRLCPKVEANKMCSRAASSKLHALLFKHSEACADGARCTERADAAHALRFEHPSPCRAGARCKDASDSHLSRFCHVQEEGHVAGPRTFATSEFKRLYLAATVPSDYMELFNALKDMLQCHCAKNGHDSKHGSTFHMALLQEAIKDASSASQLLDQLPLAAQRLWTSAKKFCSTTELCSIINAAIRADDPELLAPTVTVIRGINELCLAGDARCTPMISALLHHTCAHCHHIVHGLFMPLL